MATTSLWHIKGRLSDLIAYVENPEKTVPKGTEDFFNVFLYIQNPQKTADGSFVTAINCLKETALRQMILTKQRYCKENKYIAWHGYQSFQPGEITPELCHKIGVKLAREMWGDKFQVIVTTHLDKGHLHNHFCFNSVSFKDGRKYNYSKAEQQRLRDTSDRLCREYGLSVIEHGRKAPSRLVWLDEQSGKPTRYNVYRADVRDAVNGSRTVEMMEKYLRRNRLVVGQLLEEDFVRLNVRYIAIMDNIDTANGVSDIVPMQDLFNETSGIAPFTLSSYAATTSFSNSASRLSSASIVAWSVFRCSNSAAFF